MANGQAMLDWRREKRQSSTVDSAQQSWEQSYRGKEAIKAGFSYADELERCAILTGTKAKPRATVTKLSTPGRTQQPKLKSTVCAVTQADHDMYAFIQSEGHSAEYALEAMNQMFLSHGRKGGYQPKAA